MEESEDKQQSDIEIQMAINRKASVEKFAQILYGIETIRDRFIIVSFIIMLSVLIYTGVGKYFDVQQLYKKLVDIISTRSGIWTTTTIVFMIGIALFVAKQKQQFWYGVFETVFALITCYYAVTNIKLQPEITSLLIALGSGLYLIVRGLSNISDGSKKDFWIKNEVMELRKYTSTISRNSISKTLKDKKTLTNMLAKLAEVLSKY